MKKIIIIFFVIFIIIPFTTKIKNESPSTGKDKFYGDDWNKMDEDFEKTLEKKKPKKSKPQEKR